METNNYLYETPHVEILEVISEGAVFQVSTGGGGTEPGTGFPGGW